ncbi:peptide ABC transporter substrate-binding protein [Allorhizobium ampelinum]|uniref:ABC transporter substrate binding protein (Oligopeptide) n=3 Tax=Rhizobiaceae TaxID=82115 RepID=B9K472_ALLAM|nr:ABC transporter substrate binding protein (oligopeptide) [Allorhizobium ampelinum S4]ASK49749.1 tRNA (N6-threonylcarbamoyladenosine(37)-N6)-methyltransferase TrmO [Agrobacterium vitis]MCF1436654.1 peptide ABC transporter substrate-binding protein [Allorhizobium ampelinum]MCF1450253.1 peptide ABC transporter substrate-binding protein [Allorhizobium ampelinum]MCF1495918.1 peptide ABC transporter substrate-binding protein [Allorhizobium ampelinum]
MDFMDNVSRITSLSRRGFVLGSLATGAMIATAPHAMAQSAGQLRFGLSSYPTNLAPFQHGGTAAGAVKLAIHRGLFGYAPDGKVRPELVEKWSREGDRQWTFTLRKNAVFHNGDPVDTAAVKYMFDQITAEKSTAYLKAAYQEIEKIDLVDALTFRLTLKEPNETLLYNLASFNSPVISPKSTQDQIIGCGPYRITEQERGSWIRVEASKAFYRPGLPKVAKIEFKAFADEDSRVVALESGDVDIVEFVPWQSMARIEGESNLRLDAVDGPCLGITFNMKQGPFVDKRIRQAVAYAVDRSAVLQASFFGRGSILEGLPIPKDSFAFDPALQGHWKRDVEKARKLMQEAGASGGIAATMLSTSQYGMHRSAAEICQQNLADIGIAVELQLPDYPTRMQLGNRGQYQFSITGYPAPYADPDALSVILSGSPTGSYLRSYGYENKEVDDLLKRGRAVADLNERKKIYSQIAVKALDDAAFVGLTWRSEGYAMKKSVQGFHNLTGPATIFSPTTLEETTL